MKIAPLAEVKAQFSAYLKASEEGPVVVTRNGKPVAVLLGIRDEEEIERLILAHSPRVRAILERSREQIRAGRGIPHVVFWEQMDQPKAAKPKKRTRKKPA